MARRMGKCVKVGRHTAGGCASSVKGAESATVREREVESAAWGLQVKGQLLDIKSSKGGIKCNIVILVESISSGARRRGGARVSVWGSQGVQGRARRGVHKLCERVAGGRMHPSIHMRKGKELRFVLCVGRCSHYFVAQKIDGAMLWQQRESAICHSSQVLELQAGKLLLLMALLLAELCLSQTGCSEHARPLRWLMGRAEARQAVAVCCRKMSTAAAAPRLRHPAVRRPFSS